MEQRLPPQNLEYELSILSGMIVDPEYLNNAIEILKPTDFYKTSHQIVFKTMVSLVLEGAPVELPTLVAKLKEYGELDKCGGAHGVSKIVDIPVPSNLEHYCSEIIGKRILRETINLCHTTVTDCYESTKDVESLINEVQQRFFGLEISRQKQKFVDSKSLVMSTIDALEEVHNNKGMTGLSTGFKDLDNLLGGLEDNNLIIVAARPSMGKSSLLMNIARRVAQAGHGIGYITLESGDRSLMTRILSCGSRIDGMKFRRGELTVEDWVRVQSCASEAAEWNLWVYDASIMHYNDIRSVCRRLKFEEDIAIIMIDYLSFIQGDARVKRVQEIESITRNMKAMAEELKLPVVLVAQLNRKCEERSNKRPLLSDLRESGAIEQDADVVIFIYRDEIYNPETEDVGIAELIIAKHRDGPVGVKRLYFAPSSTKFEDLAPI